MKISNFSIDKETKEKLKESTHTEEYINGLYNGIRKRNINRISLILFKYYYLNIENDNDF